MGSAKIAENLTTLRDANIEVIRFNEMFRDQEELRLKIKEELELIKPCLDRIKKQENSDGSKLPKKLQDLKMTKNKFDKIIWDTTISC